MTYTYYFREPPDLTQPMPEGCTSLIFHRAPVWVDTLKCQVYGRAVYERKLSFRECLLHNLVEDGQRQSSPTRNRRRRSPDGLRAARSCRRTECHFSHGRKLALRMWRQRAMGSL